MANEVIKLEINNNHVPMRNNIIYLLITIFLALFFSCSPKLTQNNPESFSWKAPLQDMLRKSMINAISTDDLEAKIPIQITDNKGNKLSNASFIIEQKDNNIHLKTDTQGIVMITLNKKLIDRNPNIIIEYGSLQAKEINCVVGGKTVVFKDGKSIDTETIEYENLPYISSSGFEVYYTTNKNIAESYMDTFKIILDSIKSVTGKNEIASVSPLLTSGTNISIIGEPNDVIILPININSWHDKYWHFTHESVENELINKNDVYSKNEQLRFIGDGLAEYVSLKVLDSKSSVYSNKMLSSRIKSLNKSNGEKFDLYQWTINDERIEGYSYSLAFWLILEDKFGKKSIVDFIQSFSNSNSYQKSTISEIFNETFNTKMVDKEFFILSKQKAIDILKDYPTALQKE